MVYSLSKAYAGNWLHLIDTGQLKEAGWGFPHGVLLFEMTDTTPDDIKPHLELWEGETEPPALDSDESEDA